MTDWKQFTNKQLISEVLSMPELLGSSVSLKLGETLKVPDQFDGDFNPGVSPQQYFRDMPPIYVTTRVDVDDLGSHMIKHIKEFNLNQVNK